MKSVLFTAIVSFLFCFHLPERTVCPDGKPCKDWCDTLFDIVTDSFQHDLGTLPAVNRNLEKKFKYIGDTPVIITRTWTGDPHYICNITKDPLEKNKEYTFTVCFWFQGRVGRFSKSMGFDLSNGKRITYVFKGNIVPEKKDEPQGPVKN